MRAQHPQHPLVVRMEPTLVRLAVVARLIDQLHQANDLPVLADDGRDEDQDVVAGASFTHLDADLVRDNRLGEQRGELGEGELAPAISVDRGDHPLGLRWFHRPAQPAQRVRQLFGVHEARRLCVVGLKRLPHLARRRRVAAHGEGKEMLAVRINQLQRAVLGPNQIVALLHQRREERVQLPLPLEPLILAQVLE
eukprot:scaffold256_cov121-Isochrysis_galbana.AAC.10